jgi:hypothetical protein
MELFTGGGGEQEDLLGTAVLQVLLELAVARRPFDPFAFDARIAEMVGLVDDHRIGLRQRQGHLARPPALALQIGVVVDDQVDEAAEHLRQIVLQIPLPHVFAHRFGGEQNDLFSLLEDQPLNQHEADEGFAQADAIAEKRAPVTAGQV